MINLLGFTNDGKAQHRLVGVYIIYLKNRSHKNFHTSIHCTNSQLYMNIHGLVGSRLANPGTQARVYRGSKTQQICLIHNYNMTFQFHPVNVRILHLKGENGSRSEGHFVFLPHCYVTWCTLMTGIVTSQCPSSRDAVLVMCYLTPLISANTGVWNKKWLGYIYIYTYIYI